MNHRLLLGILSAAILCTSHPLFSADAPPKDMALTAEEQTFCDKLSDKQKAQYQTMQHRQRMMAMQLAEKMTPDKGVDVVVKINTKPNNPSS